MGEWRHQTWSSFKCSVAVRAILPAPKSNQTSKNTLQKETDTIDTILIADLAQKWVYNPLKPASSRRHVWILFRYQCLPHHGKRNIPKTSREGQFTREPGTHAGSRYFCSACFYFFCYSLSFDGFLLLFSSSRGSGKGGGTLWSQWLWFPD